MMQKFHFNFFSKVPYKVLSAFDCLRKSVKNAILTYNSTCLKEIDKKLLNNCLSRIVVNILFQIIANIVIILFQIIVNILFR